MAIDKPPSAAQARESLLASSLKRLLAGREQATVGDRRASLAAQQKADDELAFAALAFVRSVDRVHPDSQPPGWTDSRRRS